MTAILRATVAALIAPVMRATGFRFSKDYRRGVTRWHRIVYACVNTVSANYAAGMGGVRISPFRYL